MMIASRWSQIASNLPGRTDNEIKNYWNTCVKKKLKLIGIDPSTHNPLDGLQGGLLHPKDHSFIVNQNLPQLQAGGTETASSIKCQDLSNKGRQLGKSYPCILEDLLFAGRTVAQTTPSESNRIADFVPKNSLASLRSLDASKDSYVEKILTLGQEEAVLQRIRSSSSLTRGDLFLQQPEALAGRAQQQQQRQPETTFSMNLTPALSPYAFFAQAPPFLPHLPELGISRISQPPKFAAANPTNSSEPETESLALRDIVGPSKDVYFGDSNDLSAITANLIREIPPSSSLIHLSTESQGCQAEYQPAKSFAVDTKSTSTSRAGRPHCFDRSGKRISTPGMSTSSPNENSGAMNGEASLQQANLLADFSRRADTSEILSYDSNFVTSPISNNQSAKWCELMPLSHAMREFEKKQDEFEPVALVTEQIVWQINTNSDPYVKTGTIECISPELQNIATAMDEI